MTNEPPAGTVAGSPPPPPLPPAGKTSSLRPLIVILLSLCLGLFLVDAAMSLMDDTLIVLFDVHVLSAFRGLTAFFAVLMAVLIYGLMALTPMIPKRLFLPVTLFNPIAGLVAIPLLVYFHGRSQQISWVISFCQLICGLAILRLVHGGLKAGWPLVPEKRLGTRRFSWLNLSVFLLVNAFVLLPVVIVYLALCASLAVDHFSEGFLALRPGGFTVQMRKYVRADGKTIRLFPMAHVGDAAFYREISQSFPANSIILMEGVSDDRNLLTNKPTYKRMAKSLGLAEQQKEFRPRQGEMVPADVDVDQFTTNTIDFLNLVMRIHSRGMNARDVRELIQYSPPPGFQEQLFDDLLRKRNQRLLEEIHSRLSESDNIIVPWGAAHMPGIAKEIQKSGFRLTETRQYVVIRFRSGGNKSKTAGKESDK